jgi:hypothetical protein
MLFTVVYALSYVSAVALLLAWRLSQFLTTQAREHLFSTGTKWFFYTIICPRMKSSSDVTLMAGSIIMMFVVANVVGSALGVKSQSDLSIRLARLCITNIVVLYFGGRSNIVVDKVFRLSVTDYHLLHRWIGRITIIEGITHGTLCIIKTKATTRTLDLAVSSISQDEVF